MRVVVYLSALAVAGSAFAHEATEAEVEAALGRASRAAYLVELARVCGLPTSEEQYSQVKRAAILHSLERTALGAKLTDEQTSYIVSRTSADNARSSQVARARKRAENGECNNRQLTQAWAAMVQQAQAGGASAGPGHHHPHK